MATFASRPAENDDPWYEAREAYDQSVEDAIEANEAAIAAGGGASLLPAPDRAGQYLSVKSHGLGFRDAGNPNVSANTLTLVFIAIPSARTLSSIQINVRSASTAGSCRLGIFTFDFATGTATLVSDAGTVTTATTGNKTISGLSIPMPQGWLAVGMLANEQFGITGGNNLFGFGVGDLGANPTAGFAKSVTYGAFAATYSTFNNGTGWFPDAGVK